MSIIDLTDDNLIGRHMFPEIDKLFEDYNKSNEILENYEKWMKHYYDSLKIIHFIELYQKLCELTPEEISKFIKKFEEIKGLIK